MAVQTSKATWNGTLKEGNGVMVVGDGHYEGPFTHASRFATGPGTNPEELIGAAHAGCFSMFLSALLTNNGTPPNSISTVANVHLTDGPTVSKIELVTEADVPDLDDDAFQAIAAEAKAKCPISKALAAVDEITLDAKLV